MERLYRKGLITSVVRDTKRWQHSYSALESLSSKGNVLLDRPTLSKSPITGGPSLQRTWPVGSDADRYAMLGAAMQAGVGCGTVPIGRRVGDLVIGIPFRQPCSAAGRRSQLMWSAADVIGLFSLNVVSFSHNVVPSAQIFSITLVPKPPM